MTTLACYSASALRRPAEKMLSDAGWSAKQQRGHTDIQETRESAYSSTNIRTLLLVQRILLQQAHLDILPLRFDTTCLTTTRFDIMPRLLIAAFAHTDRATEVLHGYSSAMLIK